MIIHRDIVVPSSSPISKYMFPTRFLRSNINIMTSWPRSLTPVISVLNSGIFITTASHVFTSAAPMQHPEGLYSGANRSSTRSRACVDRVNVGFDIVIVVPDHSNTNVRICSGDPSSRHYQCAAPRVTVSLLYDIFHRRLAFLRFRITYHLALT